MTGQCLLIRIKRNYNTTDNNGKTLLFKMKIEIIEKLCTQFPNIQIKDSITLIYEDEYQPLGHLQLAGKDNNNNNDDDNSSLEAKYYLALDKIQAQNYPGIKTIDLDPARNVIVFGISNEKLFASLNNPTSPIGIEFLQQLELQRKQVEYVLSLKPLQIQMSVNQIATSQVNTSKLTNKNFVIFSAILVGIISILVILHLNLNLEPKDHLMNLLIDFAQLSYKFIWGLMLIISIGFVFMLLERLYPDQKLDYVPGWWKWVIIINLFQLFAVVLATFTWKSGFKKPIISPAQRGFIYELCVSCFWWLSCVCVEPVDFLLVASR